VVAVLVVSALGGACGGGSSSSSSVTLHLGCFPNVTHAPALVGVEKGIFAAALGSKVKLSTQTFNAGPAAVEAIFSGALDATFVGPNPAINAFQRSGGKAVRIVAGSTSGGASLVVKRAIATASDLKGKKVASPQLGGTQDVALRSWLAAQGLRTTTEGGGDVAVVAQDNAQTLEAFRGGAIDGAWVPEPWATRLVEEAGGKVLVDERDLWPGRQFVTTHLLVRTAFLRDHPDVVKRLVTGLVDAVDYVNQHGDEARSAANAAIGRVTGKQLSAKVIDESWRHLTFTVDPVAASLEKSADDATRVGLLERVNLSGIYDLKLLNELLKARGRPQIGGLA